MGQRWSVDETYVKVAGRWGYVYRAIDEYGQVIEVLFREHRDTEAATAFFRAALASTGVTPHTVTTDQAAAYPLALAQVLPEVDHIAGKAEQQRIERDHHHLKFLNNVVEQDHRNSKRRTKLAMGYGSFHTAWRTLYRVAIKRLGMRE